jgi:hypothetical protein
MKKPTSNFTGSHYRFTPTAWCLPPLTATGSPARSHLLLRRRRLCGQRTGRLPRSPGAAPIAPALSLHNGGPATGPLPKIELSISQLMLANECTWRSEAEMRAELLRLWQVMQACVVRGCAHRRHATWRIAGEAARCSLYRSPEAALGIYPGGPAQHYGLGQCVRHGGE